MAKELSEEQKQKNRERVKEWYKNNKEKKKEYDKNRVDYHKDYYKENKEKIKEYNKENKEKVKMYSKKYYEKKENNERKKEYNKEYRKTNIESVKDYQKVYQKINKEQNNKRAKERKENDPLYKLSCNIRSLITKSINRKGYKKESKTFNILNCSFEDFKLHLEKQFINDKAWMNWSNYGNPVDGLIEPNKTWDIDHIIPIATATNEEELLKLNHYTNLQPLCSYHNRWVKKNNKE